MPTGGASARPKVEARPRLVNFFYFIVIMFAYTINLGDFVLDISNFEKNEEVFVEIQEEG